MKNKAQSYNDILHIWRNHTYDPNLSRYKQLLERHSMTENIICPGSYITFVMDLSIGEYTYVSQDFTSILGYNTDLILRKDGMIKFSELIHPDKRELNAALIQKCWEFSLKIPLAKKKSYKYNLEYKVRNVHGRYLRFLQQVTILETDRHGNPFIIFGICTDISYMGDLERPTLAVCSIEPGENYVYDYKKDDLIRTNVFTRREKELLKLLAMGLSAKRISQQLNISFNTVRTHRRNMLNKTDRNNTAELIHFAMKTGNL